MGTAAVHIMSACCVTLSGVIFRNIEVHHLNIQELITKASKMSLKCVNELATAQILLQFHVKFESYSQCTGIIYSSK